MGLTWTELFILVVYRVYVSYSWSSNTRILYIYTKYSFWYFIIARCYITGYAFSLTDLCGYANYISHPYCIGRYSLHQCNKKWYSICMVREGPILPSQLYYSGMLCFMCWGWWVTLIGTVIACVSFSMIALPCIIASPPDRCSFSSTEWRARHRYTVELWSCAWTPQCMRFSREVVGMSNPRLDS